MIPAGDANTLVVVAIIGATGLIAVALINLYGVRMANKNAEDAAKAVKAVETQLAKTYTNTDHKLDLIHTAVDGRLSVAQNTITWLEQQLYAARQAMPISVEEATKLEHDPRLEFMAPHEP